jgi:hypothetical protein
LEVAPFPQPGVGMKHEGGLWVTAAVVGIAATVGVSSTKTGPPSDPVIAQQTTKSSPHADTPATNSIGKGPCPDIEKLLQTFFLVNEKEVVAPQSCYPDEKQPPADSKMLQQTKHLRFVIATLPDPLHTHFPLIFDRSTEAIEEAAQDDRHYVYDSSWLPWETEQASYPLINDQDKAEKSKEQREDQPGFLLFRARLDQNPADSSAGDHPFENGLAVLIVGEEPTGGIHRRQFENAVQWIAALQPEPVEPNHLPLQILAPSFSGSIPSLVELLRQPETAGILLARAGPHLRIFSGSVSSYSGVGWLHKIATHDLSALRIQFRSFQHSGNLDLDRYCRYVYAAGTEPARLAIISEDETAFGGEYGDGGSSISPCRPEGTTDRPQGPAYLYYPRDISALRAAYQNQSIFSRAVAPPSVDPSRHILQTNLADPEGKDHDTIRAYSGDQTALSQEAELQQMVSLMRAHKTQYILLRSSNPLDQLFLSHFFRMTYPEGRIVIVGADLLIRREIGAAGLNGIMTLTTYPLLPWEQDWTSSVAPPTIYGKYHSHRAFTNDGVEGTYVAARFLLFQPPKTMSAADIASNDVIGDQARLATAKADGDESAGIGFVPSNCIAELNLPDYAAPFWMKHLREGSCHHPPTWLSVLGDGGFWPVAVMDFPTGVAGKPVTGIPDLGEKETLFPRLGRSITSIFWSIVFLLGIHSNQGSVGGSQRWWLPMPPSMKLFMFAALFWAIFHALCCCRASITVKPAHRAHFVRPHCTPIPAQRTCDAAYIRRQQKAHRALLVFGSVLVALLPITLAWGYGEMWEGGEPLPHPWPYRALLSLTWLMAGLAVCANTWVEDSLFAREDPEPTQPTRKERVKILTQGLRAWARERKVPPAVWRSLFFFTLFSLFFYWCLDFSLDRALNDTNRIPTYWRAINLTTGLSPLVPLVSLIAGLYGWFWYSLQGLALFGEDRPQLPTADLLKIPQPKEDQTDKSRDLLRMLSREWAAQAIEELSSPFAIPVLIAAGICFAGIIAAGCWVFGCPPIRNLGSNAYSVVFCLFLVASISVLLANAWQLSRIWLRLRHVLQFLDKIPLRRTLGGLTGFSWGSVWKMSGNVLDMRYKHIFRQLESLTHLRGSLLAWQGDRCSKIESSPVAEDTAKRDPPIACPLIKAIEDTTSKRLEFAEWYSSHWDDWKARRLTGLKAVQHSLADTAATMLTELLVPTWRNEGESLAFDPAGKADDGGKDKTDAKPQSAGTLPPHMRNAEELVCLVYLAFIQNIVGRMRSLVMGIICIFLAITVAVSSYPFDPRPLLSGIVVALFAILGATIIAVYSQMHRDPTLSRLTGTTPGELGSDFWIKLIGFGAGPVLALVATVFPEFTGVIFSWIQPGIASIK